MRSYQVFAGMSPERVTAMMRVLNEKMPLMFQQSVVAASAAMKARPVYLKRQPFEKQSEAIRRAVARPGAEDVASELLAVYFLECRKELLIEWLDALGIEHDEGSLKDDKPDAPDAAKLQESVEAFRGADDDIDRELLLQAFAAQTAIDWPALDALLEA